MPIAERLALIAGTVALTLALAIAPSTGVAQTPPPVPKAEETEPVADETLPPSVRKRKETTETRTENTDERPPELKKDDGPPELKKDDGPPELPRLAYHVVIDGNQMGPLDEAQLVALIKGGKLTAQTNVWTKGMADWDSAANVEEVAALIAQHAPVGPPELPPQPQYYAMVNGQQIGPVTIDQIKQAIAAGQISRQTQVWSQGMDDWKVAGDVPELAGLFPPVVNDRTRRRTGQTVRVLSYCGETGKSGIGEGPDFNTARDRAIKACVANGGLPDCCPYVIQQIE